MNIVELYDNNADSLTVVRECIAMLKAQGGIAVKRMPNQCVDPFACCYVNEKQQKCAVGLLLPNDTPVEVWEFSGAIDEMTNNFSESEMDGNLWDALYEYEDILRDLQQFHDCVCQSDPRRMIATRDSAIEQLVAIGADEAELADLHQQLRDEWLARPAAERGEQTL